MQPMLPLANAQPDCPFAEAVTYIPGVVGARQQFVKQRHGPKVAGALWMYGPDHVCSTSRRRAKPNKMTPVGFEPTPFRNGALSHRLRPLGHSVLEIRFTYTTHFRIVVASAWATIWTRSLCQTFGWSDCVSGLLQERAAGMRARSSRATLAEGGIWITKCTHRDLNQGPSACEADVIPLRTPCADLLKGVGPAEPLAGHCGDGGRRLEDPMPYTMRDISPGRHLQ
jgi:hypothetical protein